MPAPVFIRYLAELRELNAIKRGDKKPVIIIPDKPEILITKFVLYRWWENLNLIYVGKSIRIIMREAEHSKDHWYYRVTHQTKEYFSTQEELDIAEIKAIQTEFPECNIKHRRARPFIKKVLKNA